MQKWNYIYKLLTCATVILLFVCGVVTNIFGQTAQVINPGGGASLKDGLKVVVNTNGALSVYRDNQTQYYSGYTWPNGQGNGVKLTFRFSKGTFYSEENIAFIVCATTPVVQNGNDWTTSITGYVNSPISNLDFYVTMYFSYRHPDNHFIVDYYVRAPYSASYTDAETVHLYLNHDSFILGNDASRGHRNVNTTGEIVGDYRLATDNNSICNANTNNPRYPSQHGFKASATGFRSYYTGAYAANEAYANKNAQNMLSNILNTSNCTDDAIAVEFTVGPLALGETGIRRVLHAYGDNRNDYDNFPITDPTPSSGAAIPVMVNFTSSGYSELEGNTTHAATSIEIVVSEGNLIDNQVVNFTASGGSAIQGTDYTYVKGFTIPVGNYANPQTLTLNNFTIIGNELCQTDRTFNISIDQGLCNDLIMVGANNNATFTIIDDDAFSVNPLSDQVYCAGASVSATTFSSPLPVTYNWTATNGTAIGLPSNSGTGDLPAFTATNAGSNPIIATITVIPSQTGSSCDGTDNAQTFTITVNANPSATITANPTVICRPGESFTLTAEVSGGTTTAMTYTWYNGTTPMDNTTVPNYTNAPTATTDYSVMVTNSYGCFVISAPVTVTLNESISATITANPTVICSGETATLTATVSGGTTTAMTYTWYSNTTPMDNTTVPNYTTSALTATTDYSVMVTNSYGCTEASNTITVTVLPVPALTTVDTAVCYGTMLDITATTDNSSTLMWYSDPLYSLPIGTTSFTATLTSSTTYYVEAISSDNCSIRDSVVVTVYPLPDLLTGGDVISCYNTPVTISAAITQVSSIITWYFDKLYTNPIVTANSITVAPATTTYYYVEAISEHDCIKRDSVLVTIYPLPDLVTCADTAICYGTSAEISAEATNLSNTITWYSDPLYSDEIGNTNNMTVTPEVTTVYYVKSLSAQGCPVYDSVTVVVQALPVLIIEDAVTCSGHNFTVTAATADPSDLIRWYRDEFYTELIMPDPAFTIVITNDTIFYVEAISHPVHCVSRGSITISVTLPPSVTAMDDRRICYGEEITLTTISADGDITWNVPQQPPTLRPTATADYIVTASRPPCPDVRDTVRITVGDSLYIFPSILPPFQRNRFYEQQLQTNAASPQYFWSGQFPNGLNFHGDGLINGVPSFDQYGEMNYTLTVEVLDKYDCTTAKTYSLLGELFIPVVFSPNNDGVNDYFMKGYKVIIFDRLGVKIFEGEDGWDGTYNGNNAPVDTYFYILFSAPYYYYLHNTFTVDVRISEPNQTTGSITILR